VTKVNFFLLILNIGFIISKVLKFDSNLPISHSVYNNIHNIILPNIGGPRYNRNKGVLILYLLR
jgi:hypothetical protein